MPPAPIHRVALVAVAVSVGACPSPSPAPPAAAGPSAAPVGSAAAPAASASAPRHAASSPHAPGVAAPARPAPVDAGAAPAPSIARLPAATSRAGLDVSSAYFDEGGRLVLTTASGLAVIDAATGAGVAITPSGDPIAFAPDGALLAVGQGDAVTLWDLGAATLARTLPGEASALRFAPDGKRLAIGNDAVRVVDPADGREIARAPLDGRAFDLAFGVNDDLVVAVNNTNVVVVSASTGAARRGGGPAETTGTFGLVVSPDGRFAAAGSPAGHGLQVFDVHAWGPRTLVMVPDQACTEHVGPSFAAYGKRVLAHGGSRWVKAFDVPSWKPRVSYHAPPGREIGAIAGDLSRAVVTREEGRGAVVVTVATGAETKLERPFEGPASYGMSEDGARVVGWADGALRVWDARTGKVGIEATR